MVVESLPGLERWNICTDLERPAKILSPSTLKAREYEETTSS